MAYFIEVTNIVHGGEGWELGEVLWSPTGPAWNRIMNLPQKGDIVIHSVKDTRKNLGHKFFGISLVESLASITELEPPNPGLWGDRNSYYQIKLQSYTEFDERKPVQEFLDRNNTLIDQHRDNGPFYTKDNRIAQKYLSVLDKEVYEEILNYVNHDGTIEVKSNEIARPGDEEKISTKSLEGKPVRVETTVSRIVRDTKLVNQLKEKYDNKCQICGMQIVTPVKGYCEGHHIKPLGSTHQGPDCEENIILLCPNHHVEFDYGAIAINPRTMLVEHIDSGNTYHNQALYYPSSIDISFLKYHYNNIFRR